MVEYAINLDTIFSSLSDQTRRDILLRVMGSDLTISEIAQPYDLTFAAVSKHLKVLEKAKLIIKQRRGKEQVVHISPQTLKSVDDYLKFYRQLWETRLDSLESYLNEDENKE
jgi:DNA-binding transcriptional ArsR family regulator